MSITQDPLAPVHAQSDGRADVDISGDAFDFVRSIRVFHIQFSQRQTGDGDCIRSDSTRLGSYGMGRFRRGHPRCELRLGSHLSEAQYELVKSGEIDIGIAYVLGHGSPFQQHVLAEDRILLALPADHPMAILPLHLADLQGVPMIGMQRETSGLLAAELDRRLEEAGVRPDRVMEAGSSEATLNLVAAGLGLAFVNRSQAGRIPPNVVLREVQGFDLPVPVAAIWRMESETPLLVSFITTLAVAFATGPAMPKSACLP